METPDEPMKKSRTGMIVVVVIALVLLVVAGQVARRFQETLHQGVGDAVPRTAPGTRAEERDIAQVPAAKPKATPATTAKSPEDAATMAGIDAETFMAAKERTGAEMSRLLNGYNEEVTKQAEAGVFEYSSATTLEAVQQHRKDLAKLVPMLDAFSEYQKALPAHLDAELEKEGVPADARANFTAAFKSMSEGQAILSARSNDLERGMYATVDEVWALLETNWGKWKPNEAGAIDFDDGASEASDKFQELIGKIVETSQKQALIQQELAKQAAAAAAAAQKGHGPLR